MVGELALTPGKQVINGQGWRVGRLPNLDCAAIVLEVVDAIGYSPTQCSAGEVVDIHHFRVPTPDATPMLEIANQFLLFGIDAEGRVSGLFVRLTLRPQVGELPVTFRMRLPFMPLDIQSQARAYRLQQATDDGTPHLMTPFDQAPPQIL
jgi:hypothetical protein